MTEGTTIRFSDGGLKPNSSRIESYSPTKFATFLNSLSDDLSQQHLNIDEIADNIGKQLPLELTETELYELASESIASLITIHPDHSILAARIVALGLQKSIPRSFSENVTYMWSLSNKNVKSKYHSRFSYVSKKFATIVAKNATYFDGLIQPKKDFQFTYFGIKTLEKLYLLRQEDKTCLETPQYMLLRVAIGIHGDDLDAVNETYTLMSNKYFIHASPTLYNAGAEFNYLSSCFLVAMKDDSIDGIYKTLHTTALVSKASGGIGLHVHNIRSDGSFISSSNGTSSGLVPMLKVFNDTARYVDQGGNKRPGAFAIYLEPWHSDIFAVLDLRKNHGKEEMRARDLFFGLWIPDLFMERVKDDGDWSLFSPDEAPGLDECYGPKFVDLYTKYEQEGRAYRVIKAQKLWHAIITAQTETGGPYMLYKDACNGKSNQKNLGVIKSSNLCCEIVEYSSAEETAVCNLGSLALPMFMKRDHTSTGLISVDFVKLHHVTKVLTRNLNKVIDVTKYPIETARYSNMRNRPMAIGVQGLADLFLELRLPFDSEDARKVNIQIFETIYHAALEASMELAIEEGPYETYEGSPASKGQLQFDLWDHKPGNLYDWDLLKEKIAKNGLRNSLLVGPMPTASTSQILGFNECFEPYTSNIYTRRVLSGEFQVVNKYLLKDLIDLGVWSSNLKDRIIHNNGSIQNIEGIPKDIKQLYRTVWEIPQRNIIDMAADRAKFIDQLQSMNIHMVDPTLGKLTSCHFYSWKKGLKTGMYYLRTQAATRAIQFTVDSKDVANVKVETSKKLKRNRFVDVEEVRKMAKKDLSKSEYHKNEEYDINDSTPVSCDIRDPGNCESCSG